MSNKGANNRNNLNSTRRIYWSSAGIIVICFSLIALIGFFGTGGMAGQKLADAFKTVLGPLAWIGPFITGGLGVFLLVHTPSVKSETNKSVISSKRRNRRKDGMTENLPKVPAAEVVSKGSGFNTYFADPDPLDENKEPQEPFSDLDEVGENFHNYFGQEKHVNTPLSSIGHSFNDYFADDEVACGQLAAVDQDGLTVEETQESRNGSPVVRPFGKGFSAYMENIAHPGSEVDQLETPVLQPQSPHTELPEQLKLEVVPPVRLEAEVNGNQGNVKVSDPIVYKPTPAPEAKKPVTLPPLLLLDPVAPSPAFDPDLAKQTGETLEEVLSNFGVKVKVNEISQGPAITRYEVQPAPGIKISRIVNLADDMALALAAPDIRIEAPIPGKSAVGIEVPNKKVTPVKFREVLESDELSDTARLLFALGKGIAGKPIVVDLARMPHLLVAGATGSGKSVCMNSIITSILYRAKPDEVKFLLIDPKMVELAKYNGIPHLIAPVVTDPKKAATALRWVVNEMETRYELFAGAGVRDIIGYNTVNNQQPPLPYVVVLIDELADLMMVAPGDVEESICRLAQKARAAGIHLVVATQRPSVDVITGIIKANIPSRIAFAVSSQIDSRTILDGTGAEKLLGKGDMLYYPLGMAKPLRVQGCFLSDQEVERVVKHWKGQAKPEYMSTQFELPAAAEQELEEDDLFAEAARLFITSGMASVSLLQRRLRVGYTRAARLMDLLEQKGVVGGFEGSKPRQVLLSLSEFEEQFGSQE